MAQINPHFVKVKERKRSTHFYNKKWMQRRGCVGPYDWAFFANPLGWLSVPEVLLS
jgi:hypothetical protein